MSCYTILKKNGTLVSPHPNKLYSNKLYKSRLAVYHGVSEMGLDYQKRHYHRLKQTEAGSLFFYNMRIPACAAPRTKFINRNTTCDGESQDFTFGK